MRVRLLLLALLACALPCRVSAQALNVIYLGKGQVLQALPPRQLSLNAHVTEFLYQPGGHAIAYAGGQVVFAPGHMLDTSVTQFVKVVGVNSGSTTQLMTSTITSREMAEMWGTSPEEIAKQEADANAHPETMANIGRDIPVSTVLSGWSGDARYLLVRRYIYVRHEKEGQDPSRIAYFRYDIGISPPAQNELPLPYDSAGEGYTMPDALGWSPQCRLLLFLITHAEFPKSAPGDTKTPRSKITHATQIYDPATGKLTQVPTPEDLQTLGWLDETHLLLLRYKPGVARTFFSYDLATGQQTSVPRPAKLTTGDDTPPPAPLSPTNAAFSFQVQADTIVDPQRMSKQESRVLWLRRAPAKLPLSSLPLGLSPGADDPQAQWSPTGRQIAFLAHGDLFVADLIVRPASPREKLAAGEPLTCAEEREIAIPNLKQIALGILMYAEDHDEKFPAAEGMRESVLPYLKDDSLFQIGKIPFVYRGKGESLASLDSPAEFVLGTMDLPCARIVIYGDGHVRAVEKSQSGEGR